MIGSLERKIDAENEAEADEHLTGDWRAQTHGKLPHPTSASIITFVFIFVFTIIDKTFLLHPNLLLLILFLLFPLLLVLLSLLLVSIFLSLNHSGYLYSASSSQLLLRGAPNYSIDTVRVNTPKRYRQL